jgi:hypothetical protein
MFGTLETEREKSVSEKVIYNFFSLAKRFSPLGFKLLVFSLAFVHRK